MQTSDGVADLTQHATAPQSAEGPPLRQRLLVAAVIAMISALYTIVQHRYLLAEGAPPDSLYLWRAAQLLLDGANPWSSPEWFTPSPGRLASDVGWRIALRDPLYYPMPAVALWMPLAMVPFLVASTLFNAGGAFFFTVAVTRAGLHRAWLCGSIPFFIAMRFGQWSPLIAAACVLPWLGAVLVAKPNLGVSVFVARPTLPAAIGCLAVLLIPTAVAPWWVADWLRNVGTELGRTAPHPAPVTMFGGAGAILLLGLLRWRRPEARLLVVLACVPQLPYWADQLPLLLAARTRREVIGLVLVTLCGMLAWLALFVGRGDPIDTMRPLSVLCTYGPVLALVLSRPNAGDLPPLLRTIRDAWTRRGGRVS